MERWLSGLLQHFGCEVVVSDDLESYKPAVDAMGREHQLCLEHARKALSRRFRTFLLVACVCGVLAGLSFEQLIH